MREYSKKGYTSMTTYASQLHWDLKFTICFILKWNERFQWVLNDIILVDPNSLFYTL